jgi:hypothetical protein
MERNTRQFTVIRDAIAQAGRPLLPQELLAAARPSAPGLRIATVYRNLSTLVDGGNLRPVVLPVEDHDLTLYGRCSQRGLQCAKRYPSRPGPARAGALRSGRCRDDARAAHAHGAAPLATSRFAHPCVARSEESRHERRQGHASHGPR